MPAVGAALLDKTILDGFHCPSSFFQVPAMSRQLSREKSEII
jgi:hypothetical protein